MLALILSVQLFAGGAVLRVRVPDCKIALTLWLSKAEAWANSQHIPFTGIASCGPGSFPPQGFVEVVPIEGKPYLLPE